MTNTFQSLAALVVHAVRALDPVLWVTSPGSRNAPLLEAGHLAGFTSVTSLDERVAGHMAMGAAIASGRVACAVCTSGTAALNYAPAVAEAFYQRVPLLVITADRPKALIDQGHGQSIRQENIFEGHLRGKALLDPDATLSENWAVLSSALQHIQEGPVHINVPLVEPLYGLPNLPPYAKSWTLTMPKAQEGCMVFPEWVKEAHRPLLVIGQWNPAWGSIRRAVDTLKAKGWLIAAEHLANLPSNLTIQLEDAWEHAPAARVDAVVTIGGAWIAKQSKNILAGTPHWHIGPSSPDPDMFGSLKEVTRMSPCEGLQTLASVSPTYEDDWARIWRQRTAYTPSTWSDLWVQEAIAQHAPADLDVHWANSTAVRYGVHTWAYGGWKGKQRHYANRGASGIDGCTSTALGAAIISKRPTWLITGELAFFYDSNALLQATLPLGFKIIILNNGGGQIFRWLEGSIDSKIHDDQYAMHHRRNAELLAQHYGMAYCSAHDKASWESAWAHFVQAQLPTILEVFTPIEASEKAYKQRFAP
ncbi:MAG: hypothetical protein ABR88_00985 [Cryomorphaceae bacterium BACL7 MAG-120322-bin74]|jgi:2-succinyl-5-enolpyruvyl-6-hydroxy-3-cyclohexene-1-carboxylate synthase|nr:MAG: hypothetical protein ABR88_00985 [Cryomorphaceae bacterium BACL7 MAG-120322-bin74]KRO83528.1 MAG: hypothetical protein ABR87_01885 [Cryomorphaceae bacterium BACL7 MAG-121220-bin83]